MLEIKFLRKIDAVNPVMIAAWPGMGNVALGTADYMCRSLKALKFAEIKIDPLSVLDSVDVNNGLSSMPKPPSSTFYYSKNHNIVIFEGEVQMAGKGGIEMLNRVLDVASELKVPRIYTAAALPLPISFRDLPEVYGVVNKESLKNILVKHGVKFMEGGHITGLNGLILGFAASRGIESVCLLSTLPQYAISLPNPKASQAIIGALSRMLNIGVDLNDLSDYIKEMDERMAAVEDRVKDVFTVEESQEQRPQEKKIPPYIMEKIEKLFSEAKLDKSKAAILKKELDRWDLYRSFEDRFLDLFKEKQ